MDWPSWTGLNIFGAIVCFTLIAYGRAWRFAGTYDWRREDYWKGTWDDARLSKHTRRAVNEVELARLRAMVKRGISWLTWHALQNSMLRRKWQSLSGPIYTTRSQPLGGSLAYLQYTTAYSCREGLVSWMWWDGYKKSPTLR